VAIVLSAVLTLAVTALADAILGVLGWDAAARVVGRVIGVLVAFTVDAGMFLLVVRVLAGIRPPRRDLLQGALLAGVGMGALRLLGTSVVAGAAGRNALLASFTVLVTLLLWINLLARIVLVAAAWTADPPLPEPDADRPAVPTVTT
jgi:membrane protein